MIFLIISIICSVTVSIFLKLAKRYKIDIIQAVTWNYLSAIILASYFFRPELQHLSYKYVNYTFIALGVLLPTIFWFLASSIRSIGIVRTDIAQRLSLFIPILASYLIFAETPSFLKICGFLVGFTAIVLTLSKKTNQQAGSANWLYPLIVFLGFGTIDVLFKQVAQIKTLPYTTSLILIFGISFVISLAGIVYMKIVKKEKIQLINFICGCLLGCFNFLNILFYLKAHRAMSDNPSTVFTVMNLGVIVIGTLVGLLVFKEKLSRMNYFGLFLSCIAIVLITISKVYAV